MLSRSRLLLGDGVDRLSRASVAVFGCGGVGSYIIEALARAGVGSITVIDGDTVAESNINRQLIATRETVGRCKAEVSRERILSINPSCQVTAVNLFYTPENADSIDLSSFDYVADAIDTVTSKIEIIVRCVKLGVPVISSMGTGNKLDPTKFRIDAIEKTSVCPLARVMRRELKVRGISGIPVLWSDEAPRTPAESECIKNNSHRRSTPGSLSFVPSCAGLMIAGKIILTLAGEK